MNPKDLGGIGKVNMEFKDDHIVTSPALQKQEGGQHYKNYKIQPIEYIVANNMSYREGNVIKYVTRHKDKNKAEDIKKAIHYLEMILEEYENG